MIDTIKIGKRIKIFRTKKGLTQAKLAEYANIDTRNLSRIETGIAISPKIDTLIKIASALEVTPNDLIIDSMVCSEHVADDAVVQLFKTLTVEQRKKVVDYIHFISQ